MRLVRWRDGGRARTGFLEGDAVVPVEGHSVTDLATLATREQGWRPQPSGDALPLAGLTLLPPVDGPGSVRDFYAFERHVATARARRGLEMEPGWYERPVFYFSNPASLLGHDAVVHPTPRGHELDFELELAWIVDADLTPVGYTVMNDWSMRDVQREEMKLSLGPAKGKDFATSLGPVLVTADELDPCQGAMRAWVNGRLYSEADLSECWWSIEEMTAFAAEGAIVRAGDVFGSGTCGTGCILELALSHGAERYPWLTEGDVVELEIEGIGRLRNTIAAPTGSPWRADERRPRPPREQT